MKMKILKYFNGIEMKEYIVGKDSVTDIVLENNKATIIVGNVTYEVYSPFMELRTVSYSNDEFW